MANSKIIVVNGAQGAGKTTVTDYLRYTIPYSNLYRLSGTSDSTITGKEKAKQMYINLLDYMKGLENKSLHLIFDQIFMTEEIYCRLGKKDYSFTDVYEELLEKFAKLDFEIYIVTLYLSDIDEYEKRLDRPGKHTYKNSSYNKENSENQQIEYLKIVEEIKLKYPNINIVNIDTSKDLELVKKELNELFLKGDE